ncbi:MAG: TetR/AcrR family transcriptional regulator [Immundisolibacteraceae bacterium]|nr:TetR/AcrR family transcriptional regulator [Immundisolibacteraceae bacterium]
MKNLHLQIEINPELYSKNPDSSELGRKVISKSIELIDEMGFEVFTFKKLSLAIKSPESSIYRYFESKHALLVYLTSWYWTWTEYRLVFAMSNVESPEERLKKALEILTQPVTIDNSISYVNEVLLSEIVFSESLKSYHTTKVDDENKRGAFNSYKATVRRVSEIVLEVSPTCQQPHMLISTVIEGAHQQKYFAEHLPSLTDVTNEKNSITTFYTDLVFRFLKT